MMGTSYSLAVAALPESEVQEFANLLSHTESLGEPWTYISSNIGLREHFLPPTTMLELLINLRDAWPLGAETVQTRYLAFCWSRGKLGGTVKGEHASSVIGCVKERDVFCERLLDGPPKLFHDIEDAKDFVRRLLEGGRPTTAEKAIMFGSHVVWCTWSEDGNDPFSFAKTKHPDELRAMLGLPPNPYDRLLVFRYQQKDAGGLLRPTVLDAGLHPYFAPPPLSEERFGRTLPWHRDFLAAVAKDIVEAKEMLRRPEALHAPIALGLAAAATPQLR